MTDPFYSPDQDKKILIKETSAKDVEPFSNLKGEFLNLVINRKLMIVFVIIMFVFIAFIIGRLFFLQVISGNNYLKAAKNNALKIEEIPANRGIIYDRYSKPMVKNIPKFSIYFDSQKFPSNEVTQKDVLSRLEKIIGKNSLATLDVNNKETNQYLVKDGLSREEAIVFETEEELLPGFSLKINSGREYPGQEFSHLLGYTGKISPEDWQNGYSLTDEIGKSGIEKQYEELLHGRNGKKRIEMSSDGRKIIATAIEEAEDGKDIVLTIDSDLQKVLADAIAKWTRSSGGKSGAGVIIMPRTGEVLSLASYPFFDNNLFSSGISSQDYKKITSDSKKPLFFRAISGEYCPGSTIKPSIGLAALEEKIITKNTTFMSTGGVQAGQWFFADWKNGGHGSTNLIKALAESVNTFFYRISAQTDFFWGLGPEKIEYYLRKIGFGKKTSIDLPNEKEGFIPSPSWKEETKNESWFPGDSYNEGIGHGDLTVTPLQMAMATSRIALNGESIRPFLLSDLKASILTEKEKNKATDYLFFKEENFNLVKEGMRGAVAADTGTAKYLNDFPLAVAGKTGTVETGTVEQPHSWFTCFLPYEDPQIVITILIENGGEGSGPALRATKEVLNWWYTNRYQQNLH